MNAAIDLRERRTLGNAFSTAAIITLAFAAPATIKLFQGSLSPNEARLSDALASALGGITLPIVGAATAVAVFGAGSALRTRADRLVSAGALPRQVIGRPLAIAIASAAVASAVAGALTVLLLRGALKLGSAGLFAHDAAATAWAMVLGAAAWTAFASVFVVRTGKAARAWIVVGIDLLTRLIPGAVAWIAPSAHVGNVLGAPPPRGFVHVPILPQLASVGALIVVAAFFAWLCTRRYQGAPAR
jgi:hypothetical protein